MSQVRKRVVGALVACCSYRKLFALAATSVILHTALHLKRSLPTIQTIQTPRSNVGFMRSIEASSEKRWKAKVDYFSDARDGLDNNISLAVEGKVTDRCFEAEWSTGDCLISALATTTKLGHDTLCRSSNLKFDSGCSVVLIDTGPSFNMHQLRAMSRSGCVIHAFAFVQDENPDPPSPGIVVHRMDSTCLSMDGEIRSECVQELSHFVVGDTLSVTAVRLNFGGRDLKFLRKLLPLLIDISQRVIELRDFSIAIVEFIRDLRLYGFVLHHQQTVRSTQGVVEYTTYSLISPRLARAEFIASQFSQASSYTLETNRHFDLKNSGCLDWYCVSTRLESHDQMDLMSEIMSPFSPWFLSEYYIGDEFEVHIGAKHLRHHRQATGVRKAPHCAFLHDMAVLFVQVNFFKKFVAECLPFLQRRIILITGQWHLPALEEDADTMLTLRSPLVHHWFSQNPIVVHNKLSALPYGIKHENLVEFKLALKSPEQKSSTLINLPLALTHKERESLIIETAEKDSLDVYYRKMKGARYIVSPMGDRPDTYRHWEAIGLGTVPICNCPLTLKLLFRDGMVIADPDAMLKLLRSPHPSNLPSVELSRTQNLLAVGYWRARIAEIRSGDF